MLETASAVAMTVKLCAAIIKEINFQFTSWVDAVIFVFSLENETSFNAIYNYYAKMSQYRNMQEIPLILVGTQGKIFNILQITFTVFALKRPQILLNLA